MIPLKNLLKLGKFPYINYFFILVSIAAFVYAHNAPSLFFLDYGVVASKLGMPNAIVPFYEKVYPFFTYMFIHTGAFHLLFNILFLYIFGGAVENRLGHGLYLFVYIVFGLIAAMVQVFVLPSANAPMLGASGAIAGVMGAYIVFFPFTRIKTLVVVFLINVYSFVIIVFWFAIIFVLAHYFNSLNGGVGLWAHVGGFSAGFLFATIARLKEFASR